MTDPAGVYCVIGDPVAHSDSPEIHSFINQRLNKKHRYEKIQIKPNDLEQFVRDAKTGMRPGFNVTLPHKEKIIDVLDCVTPNAWRIGAVNTVKHDGLRLIGYNTDAAGCEFALRRAGWKPGGTAVIIGAGGAARAAAAALGSMGQQSVTVLNRNKKRTEHFTNDFPNVIFDTLEPGAVRKALEDCSLLVNATPAGMHPHADETPVPCDMLHKKTTVFDLISNPVQTRLLEQAALKGCKVIPGIHMLIAQAIKAQEIWLEINLPESLFDELLNHLNKADKE